MSPASEQLRSDRLGRLIQEGLEPIREAVPDPSVWGRIAAYIDPAPRRSEWLSRLLGVRGSGWAGLGNGNLWVSLRSAAVMSLLVVVGLAIGRIGIAGELPMPSGRWLITSTKGNPHGLATAELAIQPEIAPRPVDLTLPPVAVAAHSIVSRDREGRALLRQAHPPREAYNRSTWLRPAPEPRFGPVSPLESLNGL